MSRRVTDLQLERFLADALSPEERAAVEAVLARSSADAEALRALRADDAAVLVAHPPGAFARKVFPARPRRLGWWPLVAFAGVAAAVVLALRVSPAPERSVKGSVAWKVTRTNATGTASLGPKGEVAPGDTLSFEVTAPVPLWAAVVSHAPDGWFVYVPAERLAAGHFLLSQGAQLDATVGEETLLLLSSEAPFEAQEVARTFERGGAVDPRLSVETRVLSKH
jgi:hypothetical protein